MVMLKALLKKQLLEFFSGLLNGASRRCKSSLGKALICVFLVIIVSAFLFMFASMAYMFIPLLEEDNASLYFSLFGIIATLTGVFGSVFMTYNTIYEAKDNDLLLSMPIPERIILFSRMTGIYISALLFESMVMIPAVAVAAFSGRLDGASLVLSIINIPVMPFAALSISCAFGWLLAVFASRLRNKSLISVFFSIIFFAVYYFVAMRLNLIINEIIYNAESIEEKIKSFLFPFYLMGKGCSGDIISYFMFFAFCAIIFGSVYMILSYGFVKIATSKKGMKKIRYKEKRIKRKSAKLAFLKKELLYLKSSPVYMLNCAIGSVGLLIFTVMLAAKGKEFLGAVSTAYVPDKLLRIIVCALGCFIASSNNLTSPAISLEARTLWFLKSVPVQVKDIFFGKIMMHIIVTGIPLTVFSITASVVIENSFFTAVLSLIASFLFLAVCAEAGLVFNLLFPKTDWTNEAAPVKQSISSTIGMFFGMILTVVFIVGAFSIGSFLSAEGYLLLSCFVFSASAVLLGGWLVSKGEKRFYDIM